MWLTQVKLILFCISFVLQISQAWPGDDKLSQKECKEKADQGDCEHISDKMYMKENCPATCREPYRKGIRFLDAYDPSFFDLSAKTANGKNIDFDRFEGYVTVVADESSLCGFTKKDFDEMNRLHKAFPYTMEVVIFPTNKMTEFSDDECPGKQKFRNSKGLEFLVMETIEINGPNTHPVYKYLKDRHYFDNLDRKYVTYFVVSPDGNVQVHEDVTPLVLLKSIQYALLELNFSPF